MSGRRRETRATPFPRTARVNEVLREVIADALERLADSDERLGLLTVTAVDTAPDLQHAVVYVSSLSDDVAHALAAQRVHLQHVIARQVRMKRTPLLEFEPDPAVAQGWRVEEILRHLGRSAPRPDDHVRGEGGSDEGGSYGERSYGERSDEGGSHEGGSAGGGP